LTKAVGRGDTLPHGLVECTVDEHVGRIRIDSQSGHNGPACLLASGVAGRSGPKQSVDSVADLIIRGTEFVLPQMELYDSSGFGAQVQRLDVLEL
jgi:hypothetical protein